MNRFIILISVFIISLSTIAQENNCENVLIRQDRVWLCTSWQRREHTAKYLKFTDSKDFMDKTYTRVNTIKKVTWDYDMTNIRIEEDIDETQAWMREENGKVYLLLDGWEPYPYADSESSNNLIEGLLYDFNAEDGSTYEGIAQYCYYENNGPEWFYEGSYHVSSADTESVGDEEVRCWNVRFSLEGSEDFSTLVYPIVEGIGIVDYGGLFYLETFDHTFGDNYYNYFECCMDLEGNILYPKDYKDELPGGGLPSSVIKIGKESASQDAPIYDILGRRITDPAPGQLYIQGGKKHIAK